MAGLRRRFVLAAAALVLAVSTRAAKPPVAKPPVAQPPAAKGRGHLLLNGGGDEPAALWPKFFELAGGKDAPIVVLPTASERPESGPEYVDDLTKNWGATNIRWLALKTREDAERPEFVAALAAARGIFFTGGDQARITAALLGSPALDAIRKVFESGGVLAGTSAGTACMSAVMITGEGDFTVIRGGAVETKPGLGFITDAIVDQHFITRQRENRLFTVILEHPDLPGFGLDEATTVWFKPDNTLEVLGDGSVMVIDASGAAQSGVPGDDKHRLGARDLKVSLLLKGDGYDLSRRVILPAKR